MHYGIANERQTPLQLLSISWWQPLFINSAHVSGQICFAAIAHNTAQHCGFGCALPPEELHIIPRG